jgi:hypothetical protein
MFPTPPMPAKLGIDVTSSEEAKYIPFAKDLLTKMRVLQKYQGGLGMARHWEFDGVSIFVRTSPYGDFIRVRAGSSPIGWMPNYVILNPHKWYWWNEDGSNTTKLAPGDSSALGYHEALSKSTNTGVFANGWINGGDIILFTPSPSMFLTSYLLNRAGTKLAGTGGIAPPLLNVLTLETDGDGVKSIAQDTFNTFHTAGDSSVVWTDLDICTVASATTQTIEFDFVGEFTPASGLKDSVGSRVLSIRADVTNAKTDHSVSVFKRHMESFSNTDGSGTPPLYRILTTTEESRFVQWAFDSDTEVLTSLVDVSYYSERDVCGDYYGTDGSGDFYFLSNVSAWRNGSQRLFMGNSYKSQSGADVAIVGLSEVTSAAAGESLETDSGFPTLPASEWRYYYTGAGAGEASVTYTLYTYVDGVLKDTKVLWTGTKDIVGVDDDYLYTPIGPDGQYEAYIHPTFNVQTTMKGGGTNYIVPIAGGEFPCFFASVDYDQASPATMFFGATYDEDTTLWSAYSEELDAGDYPSSTASKHLVSKDGLYNFRIQADSKTVTAFKGGTELATVVADAASSWYSSTHNANVIVGYAGGDYTRYTLSSTTDPDTEVVTWAFTSKSLDGNKVGHSSGDGVTNTRAVLFEIVTPLT